MAVNPEMVRIARESRGMNLKELATRLSVSEATVSKIEGQLATVTEQRLGQLAEALGYPAAFFEQTDRVFGFGPSHLFHRKRQDVPAKLLRVMHAQVNIRRWHLIRMLRVVETPEVRMPYYDLDDFGGRVESVARAVRAAWHLPPGPILNLTRAIEEAGGIVVPFDFGTNRIDGMGFWPPDPPEVPPIFFASMASTGDRLRFTLCHELGHIVMHRDYPNAEMEKQADTFAAEFLMPAEDVRPYLVNVDLARLANLKPHWRVSMSALLKRAVDLGQVTRRHATTLWAQMGRMGYRTREPQELDLPVEAPELYQEILRTFSERLQYAPADLGQMVNLGEEETRRLYFAPPRRLRMLG